MNLHEECLLKYLKFPDEITTNTEILKLNNLIMEKKFMVKNFSSKLSQLNLTLC